MRTLARLAKKEDGNFIILTVFFLILIVMVFLFLYDAIRRYQLEAEVQKLADGCAIHTASLMPSIQTPVLREGQVHVMSAPEVRKLELYARDRAEEYLNRTVRENRASGYYGGTFEVDYVDPKLTITGMGSGLHRVTYDVAVHIITPYGSTLLGHSDPIKAVAIARGQLDGLLYSTNDYNPPTPSGPPPPISIFDYSLFSLDSVEVTNIGDVTVGGMYARDKQIKINNNTVLNQSGDIIAGGEIIVNNQDGATLNGTLNAGSNLSITDCAGGIDVTGQLYANGTATLMTSDPLKVDGNVTAENGIFSDAGTTIGGVEEPFGAAPSPAVLELPVLEAPVDEDDPNWKHPIIIIDGELDFTNKADIAEIAGLTSGTIYVRGGDIHISNAGDVSGDWCFVSDQNIHFDNFSGFSDQGENMFVSLNGDIHFNNDGVDPIPTKVGGTLYAPQGGVHFNNIDEVTVGGGVYCQEALKFNNIDVLNLGTNPPTSILPPTLTDPTYGATPPVIPTPTVTLIN